MTYPGCLTDFDGNMVKTQDEVMNEIDEDVPEKERVYSVFNTLPATKAHYLGETIYAGGYVGIAVKYEVNGTLYNIMDDPIEFKIYDEEGLIE